MQDPLCLKKCETLKRLMVRLPKKHGMTLKEASRRSKVNLYKYRSTGTMPLASSILSYSEAFKIDPGWMLNFACMVDDGDMTEECALEILYQWTKFKPLFINAAKIVTDEVSCQLKQFTHSQLS